MMTAKMVYDQGWFHFLIRKARKSAVKINYILLCRIINKIYV